jgi:hypothetical protein
MALLGVAWPRDAKPGPSGPLDQNRPEILDREAVWSIRGAEKTEIPGQSLRQDIWHLDRRRNVLIFCSAFPHHRKAKPHKQEEAPMALVQFGSDFPIPALQKELERFLGNPAISLGLSGHPAQRYQQDAPRGRARAPAAHPL